ncbi:MAG: FkbM family methyltransferase [Planctomycetes bacterium]|nr:FkbM family methyltransferase [Planctomycetota bacterium]
MIKQRLIDILYKLNGLRRVPLLDDLIIGLSNCIKSFGAGEIQITWENLQVWLNRFDTSSTSLLLRGVHTVIECQEIEYVKNILPRDREVITFDVGANIGLYSLLLGSLSATGSTVYSFEPNLDIYKLLQKNISFNRLDRKIRAFPIALSDEKKVDTMFFFQVK